MPASLGLVLALAAAVSVAASHGDPGPPAAAPARPDLPAAVQAAATSTPPPTVDTPGPTGVPFAVVDDADLVLPAADVVAHGFHEAGSATPRPLTPLGTRVTGGERGDARAGTGSTDAAGPDYLVLPSRGRGTAATGAVDVVLDEGENVLAPVDGTVVEVADYALYGRHDDTLLHIRPTDAPHLEVKVLHVDGVTVAEGDQVVAGETVIADTARRIPVSNQIDRFVADALPHVHLEVVPTRA